MRSSLRIAIAVVAVSQASVTLISTLSSAGSAAAQSIADVPSIALTTSAEAVSITVCRMAYPSGVPWDALGVPSAVWLTNAEVFGRRRDSARSGRSVTGTIYLGGW